MNQIVKSLKKIPKDSNITLQDLELINKYTQQEMQPEELFKFSIALCDNEIDRDFEAFTENSIKTMANLFLGKTVIFDHDAKSSNQSARIFRTNVEFLDGKTSFHERKIVLTADAYTVKSKKHENYITDIIAGILKEVSISCAVGKKICSICGKDYIEYDRSNGKIKTRCGHIASRTYGNNLCFIKLSDIKDCYECSFVAIPAQREACVIKNFNLNDQNSILQNELTATYFKNLKNKIFKMAFLSDFMKGYEKNFQNIVNKMNVEELEALSSHLHKNLNIEKFDNSLVNSQNSESSISFNENFNNFEFKV